MVEYGHGVGQATGAGGGSPGGQATDAGAAIGQMINDAVQAVSTAPPEMLVLGLVVLILGLIILKRAF